MVQLAKQDKQEIEGQSRANSNPEALKQVERFAAAAKEAESKGVRGTQADQRFAALKELQEDATYAVKYSKAEGVERFDLIHERINAKGLGVLDPQYRAEVSRAPLGQEELKALESGVALSKQAANEATKLCIEAFNLKQANNPAAASAKLDEADKKFQVAVLALYPGAKPDEQPKAPPGPAPAPATADPRMKEFEKVGEKAEKDGTRGSTKDPRLLSLAEFQRDESYVLRMNQADQIGKLDLIHERINDLGLEVTDPRYKAEMERAAQITRNPLSARELEAREAALKQSIAESTQAAALCKEADQLRTRGAPGTDLDTKVKAAEARMDKAIKALIPSPK